MGRERNDDADDADVDGCSTVPLEVEDEEEEEFVVVVVG